MTTARTKQGRGLFYHRDSEGKSESAPPQYVRWAIKRARELGVQFAGRPETIDAMIAQKKSVDGDLFLDYGISGNVMNRPGFTAFCEAALSDPTVSHLFIPLRDRIARPDNALNATNLEIELRQAGLCIVFQDAVEPPLPRGRQVGALESISAILGYSAAGQFRRQLATRSLSGRTTVARKGFSYGGEPPYGYRRVLCRDDGTVVEVLPFHRIIKEPGHHVAWHPDPDEMPVLRRILALFPTTTASKIAKILNDEGIPSPNAGRTLTDPETKIVREVSGLWTENTINGIVSHSLLRGEMEYGKRASGDQLRFTKDGPRELSDDEHDTHGVKTIVNPAEARYRQPAAGTIPPVLTPEQHAELLAIQHARGGRLKGKPRQKGAVPNPLGMRVFCVNCGWPMYRNVRSGKWAYLCGLNECSESKCCRRNRIDGPKLTRFSLAVIRQRIFQVGRDRLERKLREIVESEQGRDRTAEERRSVQNQLQKIAGDLQRASRNMTLAGSDDELAAMRQVFQQISSQKAALQKRLDDLPSVTPSRDVAQQITAAVARFDSLADMIGDPEAYPRMTELFGALDLKVYLRFREVQRGRRGQMEPASGCVTFGSTPPPCPMYDGPTSRPVVLRRIRDGLPVRAVPEQRVPGNSDAGAEVGTSGNLQRLTRRCSRRRGMIRFWEFKVQWPRRC